MTDPVSFLVCVKQDEQNQNILSMNLASNGKAAKIYIDNTKHGYRDGFQVQRKHRG